MSDLRGFTAPEPIDPGNTGKIFGAVIVALAVCAAGTYSYETGMWNRSRPIQVASNDVQPPPVMAPAPAAVVPQPAIAPAAQNVQAPAPAAIAPRMEIARPQHVLAQRLPRAPAAMAPADIAPDQSIPAQAQPQLAPQDQSAPTPSTPSPDSESQPQIAAPLQDAPAQQPDSSATPQ